jgi:sigma-54 dependent transcriptional regulator, acetoin dehydrogenase operon transcriptional activator AcoR
VIGHSGCIKDALALGRRAARSHSTVLLYGESGTGKEVFAQAIHNDGARASGPFVAVNCAALPRDLIESEMFGYEPGSFTGADKAGRPGRFELASSGTIFLDEISEMPLDVQAKLLRVLQERHVTRIGATRSIAVDVRVIAASNRSLRELVAQHSFREDLYYRLNVLSIDLPALRERREDIARFVDESIRRSCAALHRPVLSLSPRALSQFEAYDWPGNIRQLQNIVERLVNMVDGDEVAELPASWLGEEFRTGRAPIAEMPGRQIVSLEQTERLAIREALEAMNFNVTKTADALGITRPTLYAKMKKYGVEPITGFVGE